MQISVYGSGYLGTVLSACIAELGVPVTCVDEDLSRITSLARGEMSYYEKNLQEVFRRGLRTGRVLFSTDLIHAANKAQVIYLAQDSPEQVESVAERIARSTVDPKLLVIASAVPVGTARRVAAKIQSLGSKLSLVVQPFFLTDGCAVEDFNWPDRVLLGTESSEAIAVLKGLYRPLIMRSVPFIVTNFETAELAREASTAFLATKISFINELAGLCEHVNADALDLALALGLDKKIGPRCLQPGVTLGGAFVEADLGALSVLAASKGIQLRVLEAARAAAVTHCDKLVSKLGHAIQDLRGKHIAVLGLAFKPNTASVAASASMILTRRLVSQGVKVSAYDPAALTQAKLELNGSVQYCENAYAAVESTDAVVVATAWPEFRALDYVRIKRSVRRPLIVDTKNLLDASRLRSLGYEYMGVGRA